jgi:hypothetical protein
MDPVYNAAGLALLERGEPFVELRRLYAVSLQWFRPFLAVPGRRYPSGVTDRAEGEGRIEASHPARVAPTHPPL